MTQTSADENQLTLGDIDTVDASDADKGDEQVCVILHQPTRTELARAVRSCLAHASQIVNSDDVDAATRADLAHQVASGEFELSGKAGEIPIGGLALGIDPERTHVVNGVSVAEKIDDIRHVVVDKISTLGETHAEIRERAETLVNAGVTLHLNATGTVVDSENCDAVLGVLAGLDASGIELMREVRVQDIREWCGGIDRDRGRPPLGFTYNDGGEVVPGEDYEEVRAVLSMVRVGPDGERELSKRKAAERLGVSPRTIGRALDRPEMYNLQLDNADDGTETVEENMG